MHTPRRTRLLRAIVALLLAPCFGGAPATAAAPYAGWKHAGSLWILTTPEGANLPAAAAVNDFPLLVRLHKDFFDFGQCAPGGADVRFATAAGAPLAYQIEEWDAANGRASIWVRVPAIRGNARQELRLFWGKPGARSESSGKAVFNASNGYLSVWHLGDSVHDEVGTLPSKDVGTTPVAGVIGKARRLAGNQGVFCGEKIPDYPAGAAPHSTEGWFRAKSPNATLVGWGNEGGGRGSKVRMQLRSPPHVHIDSDFADVDAPVRVPLGEWTHVVHTYGGREGKVYVNGRLAGSASPPLNIRRPARLWIGGWYHHYDFVGDVDEVRVSRVARPADWVRLQYENQKPMQTAVGPVVARGDAFSVSPARLTLAEGKTATLSARAGGAQKVYWVLERAGRETVLAVDRFTLPFNAGRVVGDQSARLRFTAVYPDGVRTKDVAVTIKEAIPEPTFTLPPPAKWDGRRRVEILPQITNTAAMRAQGAGALSYRWKVTGPATMKVAAADRLILERAQNSGVVTVSLALGNGGAETTRSTTLDVKEPASDPWAPRTPAADEKPQDNQFYARDDRNEGTLHCNGKLTADADAVSLKLYADGKLVQQPTRKPGQGRAYAFSVKLKPGLIKYRIELTTTTAGRETVVHAATNLVCGDAYIINGQSNAVATDFGKADPPPASEWVRSYGSPEGRVQGWAVAVCRGREGGKGQVGYWGLVLARRLVERHKIPVCVLNGAVGGSRIDQHQRNPANPEDGATIYGRLLWRVRQARLTHGVRGILWHQGENDQGADGPTGSFGWETYRDYFIDLAAAWKQDYPNLQHTYLFQIWPRACSMGQGGSDNMLREVQRTLPSHFSRLHVMSTLGIRPPGGCHFPAAGYAEFARLIAPLLERDHYGKVFPGSITPPNLVRAAHAGRGEIALEFDQPVRWEPGLASQFYLDGRAGQVASASASGNTLTLRLKAPSAARRITYLDSRSWDERNLLRGANGIAALTFCNVRVLSK
jgi:hypothetical protein